MKQFGKYGLLLLTIFLIWGFKENFWFGFHGAFNAFLMPSKIQATTNKHQIVSDVLIENACLFSLHFTSTNYGGNQTYNYTKSQQLLLQISIHTAYITSIVICWGKSTKPEHTGAVRGGDFVVEGQKQYSTGPVSCQRMLLAMLLWKHSWPAKIVTGFTLPSGAQQGQRYRALRRGVPT